MTTEDAQLAANATAGEVEVPPGLSMGSVGMLSLTFEVPKAPLPPPYPGEVVHHYTSTAGIIGMVENACIWASSIRSLNDGAEAQYGMDLIRDEWQRSKSQHDKGLQHVIGTILERSADLIDHSRIFVACASERGDDLGQFRNYGDVAVALATTGALGLAEDPVQFPDDLLYLSTGGSIHWRRVLYSRRKQRAAARDLFDGIAKDCLKHGYTEHPPEYNDILFHTHMWWYSNLAPLMKHTSFEQEREVRLVRLTSPRFTTPLHRASNLGVVPYVRLRTVAPPDTPAPLPIRGVHVGITPYGEPAELGVRSLLNAHGYADASVTRTAMPFRG